jgi:hypothetical protein
VNPIEVISVKYTSLGDESVTFKTPGSHYRITNSTGGILRVDTTAIASDSDSSYVVLPRSSGMIRMYSGAVGSLHIKSDSPGEVYLEQLSVFNPLGRVTLQPSVEQVFDFVGIAKYIDIQVLSGTDPVWVGLDTKALVSWYNCIQIPPNFGYTEDDLSVRKVHLISSSSSTVQIIGRGE